MKSCFNVRKRKVFCTLSRLAVTSGYTTITLSVENRGVSLAMHQHRWQSRISMVPSFCSVFGGISWVSFILSCSNRTKPSRKIGIDYISCVWAEHWRKNGQYTSRDTTKWFRSMTTLRHMLQNRWKPTSKRLNGKPYPTRHIHQTFPLSIITCSDFRSITHGLAEHHFHSYEDTKKRVDSWIASKGISFFRRRIYMRPKR